jgi:hypothetical protein
MIEYNIKIDVDALQDIQNATEWYNDQLEGLGTQFQKHVKIYINSLKKKAPLYSIRYGDVRCMLLKKFPFMIHYIIDEKQYLVEVFAVIHTSRNPEIWAKKRN